MHDLERAGGSDRSYLLVATTTGSGWVVPSAVDSFEYITAGDSAIVAIQYSHLPSWLPYLVDQERAREAGRRLFDAVYERWSELPGAIVRGSWCSAKVSARSEARRRSAVSATWPTHERRVVRRAPSFNTHYREFTDGRSAQSPEVEPVFRDGRTVRFTNRPAEDINPAAEAWRGTRSSI